MAAKKRKETTPNEIVDLTKGKMLTKELEDITDTYEDLTEDIIRVRKLTDQYRVVTKEPHGYSYIEGPNLPERLQGAYTNFNLAGVELANFLKNKE